MKYVLNEDGVWILKDNRKAQVEEKHDVDE
jgi:hypothetical protein